ncbi:uncharacterized protein LY79DRAFT_147578 [Colletotrichum navitas]|uniref:Uncharacterized protein n=1 Tax=Colletotrichum navitas TaxID=681940 RepID=A0AAD8QEM2_9PEZI|nr:uncharacterized protein LY79DRAFT_147578 [Colletotrichum navitas]KAK1599699.1 hypothetical protein LY79DRAFT_147578 [Colletotrichum navitas]
MCNYNARNSGGAYMGFDVGGMAIGLQFLCEPLLCFFSSRGVLLASFLQGSATCQRCLFAIYQTTSSLSAANASFGYTVPVIRWSRRLEDNTSSMMIKNEG